VAPPPGGHPWDVRGNYSVTYADNLRLTLNIAGARREATASGYGNVVDFGEFNGQPVTLDLTAFCNRQDVVCPSEAFWNSVSVDLQDPNRQQDLHVINVINNTVHELPAGQRAETRGGLVNHAELDRFVLGLGADSAGDEDCTALAISLAGGRFSRVGEHVVTQTVHRNAAGTRCNPDAGALDASTPEDGGNGDAGPGCQPVNEQRLVIPPGARVEGIKEGRVVLTWLGGCAFGPALIGATLSLESDFNAPRTGDLDPPPYTPVPAAVPDGGFPDASASGG